MTLETCHVFFVKFIDQMECKIMLKQNYFINEIILSVLKCEDYEQLKKKHPWQSIVFLTFC
jgi:hypothetical protein